MSQTETVPTGDKSATLAQVAPQQDSNNKKSSSSSSNKKSKKPINPEHVKSPPPTSGTTAATTATAAAAATTTTNSRPNSRAGSLRASFGSKSSGFLSLLLCCTAGAGSLLDNTDKSSSIIRRRRKDHNNNMNKEEEDVIKTTPQSKTTISMTTKEEGEEEEEEENETERLRIRTDPNDLSSQQVQQDDSYDCISTTPNSIPQQSPANQIICLLPPVSKEHMGRKCLVLDLDETLVHSSFKVIPNPDFIVPVEIDNQYHNVYVLKRPGVDEFMRKMGEKYEIVIFTASLSKYADPVLDKLDIHKVVKHRLFREACCNHKGNYVKDLSHLGRDLTGTMILDNSPASYIFHNANAVPVSTWFNDPHDTELTDLVAFLEDLTQVDDVTMILDNTLSTQLHPFSTCSFASA